MSPDFVERWINIIKVSMCEVAHNIFLTCADKFFERNRSLKANLHDSSKNEFRRSDDSLGEC